MNILRLATSPQEQPIAAPLLRSWLLPHWGISPITAYGICLISATVKRWQGGQQCYNARMAKVRVLLADDHAVVRSGIRNALQDLPDLEVVGEVGDGPSLVQPWKSCGPICWSST